MEVASLDEGGMVYVTEAAFFNGGGSGHYGSGQGRMAKLQVVSLIEGK